MKRLMIAAAAMLTLMLGSCESHTATDILAAVCSENGEIPPLAVFFDNGADNAKLTPELCVSLYGSSELLDAAESYAVALTSSTELFEVHVVRPKRGRELDVIDCFEERLSLLGGGNIEELDPLLYYRIIENAYIESADGFCILRVMPTGTYD